MDTPSPAGRFPRFIREVNPGLVLALLIAGVTRLGWLGLVEFQYDESWALGVASTIARGQALPLVGIGSSLGIPNAPFFVYLMAIPELIGRDPRIATGFIGLLGVAAVAATYGLASCLFDRVTATVAALIYAVSPWGIIYSRKVWGQDGLPLFVTLGLGALFLSLKSGRRWPIAPGLLALTLASQLHPTAFFLVVPAAILVFGCLAVDWPHLGRTLRPLAVWVLGTAVVEAPFLFWQSENGWPLADAVSHLARDAGTFDLQAVAAAVDALVGDGYATAVVVFDDWGLMFDILVGLLLGGSAIVTQRLIRGNRTEKFTLLAIIGWLLAPIVLQLRHTVPIYQHYFIVLYPVGFIVMGLAVSWFGQVSRGYVGKAAVVALVVVGLISFGQYVDALDRGAVHPDFGVPLGRQIALVDAANRLAAGGPVYVGTHDSLAPTLAYLSDDRWRIFDDRRGVRLPDVGTPSVLIISDSTSSGGALATRWFAGEHPVTTQLTETTAVVTYLLAPTVAESSPDYHALNLAFDNGMTLVGYRILPDSGARLVRVDLHWRFAGLPPAKPPNVFAHLIAADGQQVPGRDGPAYDPKDWRTNELDLVEIDFAWPPAPGTYSVEVGLYDFPSLKRFQVANPGPGEPADSVRLEPILIR
jgi:4-amino-4-deoxy-L-arabinose transferase-like glycosyltransferase